MRNILEEDETEGVLFIDATNAFNSLNRHAALKNIQSLCPSLATIVMNTYQTPTKLYFKSETVVSAEATTQGDPLAMSIYAIAVLPLIFELESTAKHLWYADDATARGKL